MKRNAIFLTMLVAVVVAAGCKGGGDDGGSSGGPTESGDCVGGGWCGEQSIDVTANIADSEALFIAASDSSVVGSSLNKAITVSSESPLFSVTTSGIVGVLAAAYEDGSSALDGLPRLSFVAVSPTGHVVLVFEHSFIFTETAADGTSFEDYSDPWSPSSPFTCQIFVANQKIGASGLDASAPPGLTCLTTDLELNTWDFRAAMIQFDGDGGVYFSAHVPQNWKNILLKWTPGTDDTSTTSVDESVDGTLAEVINANICFREFLVTNEGGVLYTGISSTNGDCNGTSFLRYRTPAGALQELTSGWWDYVFTPIESTTFSASLGVNPDIATDNVGQILFYGPNPEVATSPDWDDACLFQFNPDASGDERSTQIADCQIDVWQYVQESDDLTTQNTRCTETKSMMGGGHIPEKILLADFNQDGSIYEVYVIGDIFEKKEGEWLYDFCINENYCTVSGIPEHDHTTSGACTTAGGTWDSVGQCFNQQTSSAQLTEISAADDADWQLNGQWCQQPGGDWRDTFSSFAWVIHDDNGTASDETDDTRQIVRFSDDDEIVRNGWIISNRLVYSAFNTDDGAYLLREILWTDADDDDEVDTNEVTKATLLTGIEVYELLADPRSNHAGEWFFNGLRFSDNQYITGTFNPDDDDPDSTLATEAGITGQIETLVIVPEL